MTPECLNLAAARESQDRVEVLTRHGRVTVLLADGAGGVAGGSEAAQLFVEHFSSEKTTDSQDICIEFSSLDSRIQRNRFAGETTGVFVSIVGDHLYGASVGDSEAWFLNDRGELSDLTHRQRRKPLLGSGEAMVFPFTAPLEPGILLVASDGLFKYAPRSGLISRLSSEPFETLTTDLADLARLPTGGLQDDLSLAVVRIHSL